MAVRKLLESEFPGEDIEQILQKQKLYLSKAKTDRSNSERGTRRRGGRRGRRRTASASMKGVTIPQNDRPNTRASLILPSIPVSDKGKKIIEGPSEVKERSTPKANESFSEQVTIDVKLALINEEEEEDKEVIEMTLRKKKENTESKTVDVTNPVERKNSKALGYIIQAS